LDWHVLRQARVAARAPPGHSSRDEQQRASCRCHAVELVSGDYSGVSLISPFVEESIRIVTLLPGRGGFIE
jgi:hypothetical protein